jgi:hypothetical protein
MIATRPARRYVASTLAQVWSAWIVTAPRAPLAGTGDVGGGVAVGVGEGGLRRGVFLAGSAHAGVQMPHRTRPLSTTGAGLDVAVRVGAKHAVMPRGEHRTGSRDSGVR